jgi:threonine/homoserine/homoserine lactone efflux protein
MDLHLLPALTLFAFVTSITPGPNNMMLMASGANFGMRRTLPHMAGVSIGFVVMAVLVGIGLIQIFNSFPVTYTILKWGGLAYMLWLAFKIATQTPKVPQANPQARPITFLQACAFQWVNPKAWSMALNAVTLYSPDQTLAGITLVAVIFGLVNLPSVAVWAFLGQQMRRFLTSIPRLRAFNITMAGLLLLTLIPVLWH